MADYWGQGKAKSHMLPLIAVPTTAGPKRVSVLCVDIRGQDAPENGLWGQESPAANNHS